MSVVLHDFHEYFDGALGMEDLRKFKMNISFSRQVIFNESFFLPIKYYGIPAKIIPENLLKTPVPPMEDELEEMAIQCFKKRNPLGELTFKDET